MRRFALFVLFVLVAVLLLKECNDRKNGQRRPEKFTAAEAPSIGPGDVRGLLALDEEFTKLVESVVPSVVSINTAKRVRAPQIVDPFDLLFGRRLRRGGGERIETSLGSGVIVSKEGHILTNNHVIADVDQIEVLLHDGRRLPARIIGSDQTTDLAVLKIDTKDVIPLALGDSDKVRVGQRVVAIGNPFGLEETVTQGIISAKGRRAVQDSALEFFQTDAPINPGNSGGPLVSLRGEIIGINSAIGDYSGTRTWQGVGFVIPSNTARQVMESLLKTGRVVRGYLGIVMQDVTPELAAQFEVKPGGGVLVAEVAPDSPALRAGLKSGDIIKVFDGKKVPTIEAMRRVVSQAEPGKEVKLEILRDGKTVKMSVVVGEQPAGFSAQALPQQSLQNNALAGLRIVDIPDAHRSALPPDISGVMIAAIENGAPAAEALQPGDIIESINRQNVRSAREFQQLAQGLQNGQPVRLGVVRGMERNAVILRP